MKYKQKSFVADGRTITETEYEWWDGNVKVSKEHIRDGVTNFWNYSDDCSVALALKDALVGIPGVEVNMQPTNNGNMFLSIALCRPYAYRNGWSYHSVYISKWDGCTPISFKLNGVMWENPVVA